MFVIILAHSNLDFRDLELGILIFINFVLLLFLSVIVVLKAIHWVDIEIIVISVILIGFSYLKLV